MNLPPIVGKFLHIGVRVAQVVLLGMIIFGLCVLFIISVVQQHYPNAGEDFPSTETEHYGYNKDNTTCGGSHYDGHLPVRFRLTQDADVNPRYEYCGWRKEVTAWRCVVAVFEILVAGALIGILRKRSPASDSAAIWENPKRVLKVIIAVCGVMAGALFILLIADGDAVNKSRKWCLKNEDSMNIVCDYTCFVTTIVIEVITMLLWGILLLTVILRNTKYFQKYMQLDEEDDYGIPMTGGQKDSSAGYKSSKKEKRKPLFDRSKK